MTSKEDSEQDKEFDEELPHLVQEFNCRVNDIKNILQASLETGKCGKSTFEKIMHQTDPSNEFISKIKEEYAEAMHHEMGNAFIKSLYKFKKLKDHISISILLYDMSRMGIFLADSERNGNYIDLFDAYIYIKAINKIFSLLLSDGGIDILISLIVMEISRF
jgi:hypothetical protein